MTPTLSGPTPATYGRDDSTAQFSVWQYQRMIDQGILTPDDRVELLEHFLVNRMAGNPPHDNTISRATHRFIRLVPDGWVVRVQLSLTLPDSQPEPDFLIARGDDDTYATRHPGAADVAVAIEVAHTSLLRDKRDKARIYARAGVACYWIVNLVEGCIEVHEQPSGPTAAPAYGHVTAYQRGQSVPLVLDGVPVANLAVAEILG